MKIVAIMGSHRKNGHTRKILNYFLDQIKEGNDVTTIDVNTINVKHCLGCDYCLEHQGECVIKDDDMGTIYKEIMASELFIIASPVYFSAFPSRMKMLIDRTQVLYNLKDTSGIKDKKLVTIGLGGAPHYGNQFKGIEYTLEWYVKNLKAIPIAFVEIAHTDETPALNNKKARAELDVLAKKIKNN